MNRIKRWALIFCIISLTALAVGCDMIKVDAEKDRKRVVAKVDNAEILKGEFLDIYNQSKLMYGITEETEKDPELKETVQQLKEMILSQLITEKLVYNKAMEAGFEINDTVIDETKERVMSELEESLMEDENMDRDEAKESAKEQLEGYIAMFDMTEDEFWNTIAEQEQVDKFIETQLEDVKVTDEDVKTFYDEQLKEQKSNPDLAISSNVQLHIPEGYRRVKHILIDIPEEQAQEYGELVADEKQEDADKLLKEELAKIESQAEEVLTKAKEGKDFEELIEEYSADYGMDIDDGYTLSKETNFVEPFKDAVFDLKAEGDISELVASEYGYHIIKLYDLSGKDFGLEEKRGQIEELVENEQKNVKWTSILEEWESKADIKRYEKRL